MAIPAGSTTDRVYKFTFDGIKTIACAQGRSDDNQILIHLSSTKKVTKLVQMCQFNESNPKYSQFYFSSDPCFPTQLFLHGPDGVDHAKLLETLQSAIVPKKGATVFEFTRGSVVLLV